MIKTEVNGIYFWRKLIVVKFFSQVAGEKGGPPEGIRYVLEVAQARIDDEVSTSNKIYHVMNNINKYHWN